MKTVAACVLLAMFFAVQAQGQIPRTLSYQGILSDTVGTPKPDGPYTMIFRLYDVPSAGSALWFESKSIAVKKGLFSTMLGSVTPFPQSMKFDKPYWLGIQVGADPEMSPRMALSSVGYSLNSARADTAAVALASTSDTTWKSNGSNIYRLTGNVGIGTSTPSGPLVVDFGTTGSLVAGTPIGNGPGWVFLAPNGHRREVTAWNGGLYFGASSTSGAASPSQLTLEENGYVGIGTFSPTAPLTVSQIVGDEILFTGGTANADISSTTELKLGTHGTFPLDFITNDQYRMVVQGGGNVGIGTTVPTTKLDVAGDVHVSGNITKDFTAGTPGLAVPVAYGCISKNGSVSKATPNVTSAWNATNSWYEITIAGESYNMYNYVTVATPMASSSAPIPVSLSFDEVNHMLLIHCTDAAGAQVQSGFNFVVYKP